MSLQLDERMWAKILEQSGKEGVSAATAATGDSADAQGSNDVVYLLALEGDRPNPKWTFWERALDKMVQTFQPAPAMTHVELFLPPGSPSDECNYATYLGKESGFGSKFGNAEQSRHFYLEENGSSWRAVPVMASGAAKRVREECARQQGASYGSASSLFNYHYAVPPFRSLAWTVDMRPSAPAHCASLTARCLDSALPELDIPHTAAWYGPSTLFLELSRTGRMQSYARRLSDMEHTRAIVEDEEATAAEDHLLRWSDDRVREMTSQECQAGIDRLTQRCVTAATSGDATAARVAERSLARGLLRYSLLQRGGPPDETSDDIVAQAEAARAVSAPDGGGHATMFR